MARPRSVQYGISSTFPPGGAHCGDGRSTGLSRSQMILDAAASSSVSFSSSFTTSLISPSRFACILRQVTAGSTRHSDLDSESSCFSLLLVAWFLRYR